MFDVLLQDVWKGPRSLFVGMRISYPNISKVCSRRLRRGVAASDSAFDSIFLLGTLYEGWSSLLMK